MGTARTGQLDLDWDEPTTDGGAPISDYAIQYSIDSGSSWTTLTDGVSSATFATIRSLAVGISHIFRVSAINEVGTGVASTQSAPVTTIGALTNDPFSGATTVSSATGYLTSSTLTATRETGEPLHGGYLPSASLWYKWVAIETGTLVLTTYGSDFDTLLGAYTGSTVNALTTLAVNDDAAGETGVWSRVTITVSAGQTYFAAIDGYSQRKVRHVSTGRSPRHRLRKYLMLRRMCGQVLVMQLRRSIGLHQLAMAFLQSLLI